MSPLFIFLFSLVPFRAHKVNIATVQEIGLTSLLPSPGQQGLPHWHEQRTLGLRQLRENTGAKGRAPSSSLAPILISV